MLRDPLEATDGDDAPRLAGEPPREHLGVAAHPSDAPDDADLHRIVRARIGDPVRHAFNAMVGSHVPAGVAASLRRRRP